MYPTLDSPRRVRVGIVNRKEWTALFAVLAPYYSDPITSTVIKLAARVARLVRRMCVL